jgi:hypothetical protein
LCEPRSCGASTRRRNRQPLRPLLSESGLLRAKAALAAKQAVDQSSWLPYQGRVGAIKPGLSYYYLLFDLLEAHNYNAKFFNILILTQGLPHGCSRGSREYLDRLTILTVRSVILPGYPLLGPTSPVLCQSRQYT